MSDKTEYQIKAQKYASDMAGEYLESIEKTDLATMTNDEWMRFIDLITIGYELKKIELTPCPF